MNREVLYQIEVLDFSKRNNHRQSDAVVSDTKGIYQCYRCGWEGKWLAKCPKCDNPDLQTKGKIKVVDTLPIALRRTLLKAFTSPEKAKRWASRIGSVISCEKVGISPYLENIEHLNLNQEPIELELEKDYVLNKALELERPRMVFQDRKNNVEVEQKPID